MDFVRVWAIAEEKVHDTFYTHVKAAVWFKGHSKVLDPVQGPIQGIAVRMAQQVDDI